MSKSYPIAAATLAVALAALVLPPGWLGATEPVTEAPPAADAKSSPSTPAARPPRSFLGVGLRELTPELQTHFGAPEGSGVLVASVRDDSPAAAAGIRVGDVITAVDGLAVDSSRDLSREIRHRPGATVAIELYRDRRPRQLSATLGERQARAWPDGGRSPEEWAELAARWERWGERFGERMGRWGEELGERWGEEHAEEWQRLAEEMAANGEGWEKIGEEIGRTVEKALSEVDWSEIGRSVDESMKALEEIDWEEMSERIERHMEEMERRLEASADPGATAD